LRIRRIHLTNFRNFRDEAVEFGPSRNLLVGANAQGKTSVLEAIHLLGVGRSHRDRKEANLVRFGEAYYRLEGVFEHIGVRTTIEAAYGEERKRIRINGKEARPADLIGLVGVVVSSPDDIDLVKGSPGFRRQFLDIAISQISRAYLESLQKYVRALAQRNRLLKAMQTGRARSGETAAWDSALVASGAAIVDMRLGFLDGIRGTVETNFSTISGAETRIDLTYDPKGYNLGGGGETAASLAAAFESQRDIEVARGYTVIGPHVDDFQVLAGGRDIRRFGSEGEQRTGVLALRCAEVTAMKAKTGRYPIVLLDDVFAELDQARTEALTALISGYDQIILTSSRPAPDVADDVWTVRIANGRVETCGSARESGEHTGKTDQPDGDYGST
jgi:DNA replication and repair protein RecF